MANDKRTRGPAPTLSQLAGEVKTLRAVCDQLKATVGKLKDILQVQDNWHSRVSKWIGKEVHISTDQDVDPIRCKLLWTDRYNIGVRIAPRGGGEGKERLYNKGHVVWIEPA
jgi:hypothetical protein